MRITNEMEQIYLHAIEHRLTISNSNITYALFLSPVMLYLYDGILRDAHVF